ncbi:MAG: hypothetical protein H7Y32_02195 [Chloroflexales bacterium]|nr:hypothetical protein [Chloroflexales bacterium]
MLALLTLLASVSQAALAAGPYTVVTPSAPDGWQAANVRANATVSITTSQPRGDAPNNLGSLEFATNTIVSGQDKADYVKYWGVVPSRTLGNLSALTYELYRASSSTTAIHHAPAFRLAYVTPSGDSGLLIWENVYNGGSVGTPVPTDQWLANDILAGNFWMRAFGPGRTIEQYDVTLAEWANGATFPNAHVLGPDTSIIGIETGVGSGWGGSFTGFVDNIAISFGVDSVSANFEPNALPPQCDTDCFVDDDTGNDANGGTSFVDAKKTIQAGINQVSSGGTVHVNDGVYNEDLLISKPLTLEGNQYGVLAKGRPGAQAIVKATNAANPVDIQADNVTIDGFVFNASAATSRPWVITALPQGANDRFEQIEILNNEFIGNPGDGINPSNPGGAFLTRQDDVLIAGNYFNNLGNHAVFLAAYGDPNGIASQRAIYRNNDSYSNYNSNVSTQEGKHFDVTIENNRAVEDDMILFNINGGTIKNNTLTGATNALARAWFGGGNHGVVVDGNTFIDMPTQAVLAYDPGFGYGGNSDFTVTNNEIKGDVGVRTLERALIDLRDVSGTVLVDGNKVSLSGTLAPAALAVYGVALRGTIDSATVSDNEIDGGNVDGNASDAASAGVWLRGTLVATAKVTIKNNTLTGFTNGIAAEALVAGVEVNVTLNSLLGSANGLTNASTAVAVAAESNWWGSSTGPSGSGPGTGAAVSGNVDFTPWLCSGTDTSPNVGFQPNPTTLCGVATALAFSTQPGGAQANQPLNPQPVVQVVDGAGQIITSFNGPITLSIGTSNPAGGTLNGTVTVNAVNGVATFTTLSISQAGSYTLVANGGGLPSVTSAPFTITAAGPPPPAPAQPGLAYAIDNAPDKGRSLLYTFNPATGQATPLAQGLTMLDLEDVAIQPAARAVYAATGTDSPGTADDGAIYRVDGVSGALTKVCKTTYGRITVLKFRATDGTLWGWAEGSGLIRITLPASAPGVCTTQLAYSTTLKIEGMAWAPDGKLYLAIDKKLYQLTVPATGAPTLITYATNLPSGTEALEIRADGKLVGGNKSTPLKYYVYNIATKSVESMVTVTGVKPFKPKSIEGLALAPANP